MSKNNPMGLDDHLLFLSKNQTQLRIGFQEEMIMTLTAFESANDSSASGDWRYILEALIAEKMTEVQ